MLILIVGAGRVGSSVARTMLAEGHEVSCLDEDPDSHARLELGLDTSWEDAGGQFTVGTGLEIDALPTAGIERADVFVASTNGDNTNIVIAQIAQRRFGVETVIARILDPYRAEWYEQPGADTVCPTRTAIEMLETEPPRGRGERRGSRMGEREGGDYMLVVGGGKVGWNLARELIDKGHEVTLIEADRERYLTVEQELEHRVLYGDASELWVLERAGIARAEMVIAVTGDDEDNLLICQVAKDKYDVDRVIARVNNPRNRQHFELLGVKPYVSATDLILRLIERAGAALRARPPARPRRREDRDHRPADRRGRTGRRQARRRAEHAEGEPADQRRPRRQRVRADGRDGARRPATRSSRCSTPAVEEELTDYLGVEQATVHRKPD